MATRWYLRSTAGGTDISPNPSASWEDTTGFARAVMATSKAGTPMGDYSFSDSDITDRDCMLRQYVSAHPLAAGQTITGAQAIKGQIRAWELLTTNNVFLAMGIRVIASDGSTVRKTVLDVTRDATELGSGPQALAQNRAFAATSAAGDYTTVAGDYLVSELGVGGDPTPGSSHSFTFRLGDASASDLPEDDTTITDNTPWIELTDTLAVSLSGSAGAELVATTHLRQDDRSQKYGYGYAY